MWLRRYGEAIEADLAFRGHDLLDFYRGGMSARRLWVLVQGLGPDSATAHAARAADPPPEAARPAERRLASVKYLEDIPVAKSLADAGRFLQASGDEFSETFGQTG